MTRRDTSGGHRGLGLLAVALTASVWGCAPDLCTQRDAAFQVDLSLDPAVASSLLHRLTADVSAAGTRKKVSLNVSRIKAAGEASFDVTVGPAGDGGFDAVVRVEATDIKGFVLARASLQFKGSGDACNRIALTLRPLTLVDSRPGHAGPDQPLVKDGPKKPNDLSPDVLQPDANTHCGKDGTSCMGGKGTCYKGVCCTGCWANYPLIGIICQPGTTAQHCGLGGSVCVQCVTLFKCHAGACVPAFP